MVEVAAEVAVAVGVAVAVAVAVVVGAVVVVAAVIVVGSSSSSSSSSMNRCRTSRVGAGGGGGAACDGRCDSSRTTGRLHCYHVCRKQNAMDCGYAGNPDRSYCDYDMGLGVLTFKNDEICVCGSLHVGCAGFALSAAGSELPRWHLLTYLPREEALMTSPAPL